IAVLAYQRTQAPDHEIEIKLKSARDDLARCELDASLRVMDAAAHRHGLMVRDADVLKRDFKGEVVAASSQHVLVQVSEMLAVRYEKGKLDRDVQIGEKLVIQYGRDKNGVYEQGKEPVREQ